ncbi:MAG TPA: lysylphosphatidylglycerol synthase domain-containing protein [Burkholderiaceae bacterium]
MAALRAWPHWPALWKRARQIAPWALALLVLTLLAHQAGTVNWREVWQALLQQSPAVLAVAAALALLSHALVSSYDLVARHETGHRLSAPRTLGIAAVCYAFNLNFGSLVGALAMKLRLYGRAGLKAQQVARIIVVAVVTNWLGYLTLGGLVLALAPPPLPPQIELSPGAVRAIGAVMLAVAAAYLALCVSRHGRTLQLSRLRFAPPAPGVAAWQLAVSLANWALMGLIVWLLLGRALPYTTVLPVLLLAAVAGVATHVPAGLGVIEAVFVACLGNELGATPVLAALLSYRAVYYLAPLALALLGYAFAEVPLRRERRSVQRR